MPISINQINEGFSSKQGRRLFLPTSCVGYCSLPAVCKLHLPLVPFILWLCQQSLSRMTWPLMSNSVRAGIWWNRFLVKTMPCVLSHKAVWALYVPMGKIKWWPCVFPECWVWSCSAQPGICQAFDKFCFPSCACLWASLVPADTNVSAPCSLAGVLCSLLFSMSVKHILLWKTGGNFI